MKRKYLNYKDWVRIKKSRRVVINAFEERFDGCATAIFIEKVNAPLTVDLAGKTLCLADDGYTWIQQMPARGNWALTTMFDENDNIIEWYFDITKQNVIDETTGSFFDDLYLDVVVLPTGEIFLLDEDELKEASDTGDITQNDYELAYNEANKIMKGMAKDVAFLTQTSFNDLAYFKALLNTGEGETEIYGDNVILYVPK